MLKGSGQKLRPYLSFDFHVFIRILGNVIFYVTPGSGIKTGRRLFPSCGLSGIRGIDGHMIREKLEPAMAVRCIGEDLTLLNIPVHHAQILPGHCWRPPDLG